MIYLVFTYLLTRLIDDLPVFTYLLTRLIDDIPGFYLFTDQVD